MNGKKWIVLIIAVFAAVLLAVTAVFLLLVGDRVTFTATVLNVRKNAVLANVNGAQCWVSTRVHSDVPVPMLKIGDVIRVVHNGVVEESYPERITYVYEITKPDGTFPMLTYKLSPKIGEPKKQSVLTEQNSELGCAIYYYGLDGMDVTVEGQKMSLEHALAYGVVSAEYWLSQAQMDASSGKCELELYDDGGSKVYRYDDYALLKMNTLDGDRTLYIGTPDLNPNVI